MVFDASLSPRCHSAARVARVTGRTQPFLGQRASWKKKIPNQSVLLAAGNSTGNRWVTSTLGRRVWLSYTLWWLGDHNSSGWFLVAVDGTSTNYFSTVVFIGHGIMAFLTANGIFKPAGTVTTFVIS